MTKKIKPSDLDREAERLMREGKMPTLEELLTVIAEVRKEYAPLILQRERNPMEPTPNKPPLEMTIGQIVAQLAKQAEHWSEKEKEEFKKAWVEGAERMSQETAYLRRQRLQNRLRSIPHHK
jgi:hypothetical protein